VRGGRKSEQKKGGLKIQSKNLGWKEVQKNGSASRKAGRAELRFYLTLIVILDQGESQGWVQTNGRGEGVK